MDYIVILERTAVNPLMVRYLLRANVPDTLHAEKADLANESV